MTTYVLSCDFDNDGLTEIEQQIAKLRFSTFLTYQQIADNMCMPVNTIYHHARNIRKKKGVKKIEHLFKQVQIKRANPEK